MKSQKSFLLSANNFYDEISDFYGEMINFESNLVLRTEAYKKIFVTPGITADFGCGSGLDSIALAKNGHQVTAFDISPKMIDEVKRNAVKYNVNIETHIHSFTSLPKSFNKKFNYVVSVGNTIAHLDQIQIEKAIKRMYNLLLPSGIIFLHILNYDLIKKQNKKINNIADRDEKFIIRFYDFRENDIDFNILSFQQDLPNEFRLVTTKHYPHSASMIKSNLKSAGFSKIKFMDNFAGDKFTPGDSRDIFIEAEKEL